MRNLAASLAFLAAASCAGGGGRVPETDQEWRALSDRCPDRFAPALYAGYDAVARRDWAEFERRARAVEERAGEEKELAAPLGTLFLAAGQAAPPDRAVAYLQSARGHLERALQHEPGRAQSQFNLGMACLLLRDPSSASPRLQEYAEAHPEDLAAARVLIHCLIEQGDPAGGLRWVERAFAGQESFERHELASLCHYMMGQHERAIRTYEAALRIDPSVPRLWHNLGLCYEESRQAERARECFERARALRSRAP